MSSAKLKWSALTAACLLALYGVAHHRTISVREYLTSAQVYWRADQAVITITTTAEVRSEGLLAKGASIARGWVKLANSKPDLRAGAAHVFTLQNGRWQDQKLDPRSSPQAFMLWPYNGRFYTWGARWQVHEWNGQQLLSVPPQRAAELHRAFPDDPNNFLPAGTGASPQPYGKLQDAINRNEWHAYLDVASLPEGKHLVFLAGGREYDLFVHRSHVANSIGEISLTVSEGGNVLPLWQSQPMPRIVSEPEVTQYL